MSPLCSIANPATVDDFLCPAGLDSDDDASRYVWIRTRSDHDAEVQIQVFAELQAAVSMRQGHRSLDVVGHRFTSRIRDIVYGQDGNIVADTDTAVLAPVAKECG